MYKNIFTRLILLTFFLSTFFVTATSSAFAAPSGFHVQGNHFEDARGNRVILRGATRWSLEFSCGDNHFTTADFQAMKSWGMNTVRLSINQNYFLNPSICSGKGQGDYQQTVYNAIATAKSVGMYVLIDLHWTYPKEIILSSQNISQDDGRGGQYPLPDVDSIQVWKILAQKYANDDQIFFEPMNEPHPTTCTMWHDGGTYQNTAGWIRGLAGTYQAVGIQKMVDTIRQTGANNVIIVGPSGEAKIDCITQTPLTGTNIAYQSHFYSTNPSTWHSTYSSVFANTAIIAGEFDTRQSANVVPMFENTLKTGYLGFAWESCTPNAGCSGISNDQAWLAVRDAMIAGAASDASQPTPTPTASPTPTPTSTPLPTPTPVPGIVGALPPMGYDHYNHFGDGVNETQMMQIADAMHANGMQQAGYQYFILDDSWQGTRDSQGVLQPNSNFANLTNSNPSIGLIAHLKSLGMKVGIYTSPSAKTCAGKVGSLGYEDQDVRTFASWGIDYIKLDWCGSSYSQSGVLSIVQLWRNALNKVSRPIYLSINAGGNAFVGGIVKNYVNSWRTGPDICSTWSNTAATLDSEQVGCFNFQYHDGIIDVVNGLNGSTIQASAPNAGPGHWSDPDMLEVGNKGLSFEEAKTHFSIWAMWSAPLIAGNDPRTMSVTYHGNTYDVTPIYLNKEVIAIDQDPLGVQAVKKSETNGVQVWLKPLAGGQNAVLLLNQNATSSPYTIQWSDLGITNHAQSRDLWNATTINTTAPSYTTSIASHGVVMPRVGASVQVSPTPTPTPTASPKVCPADLNGDGIVNLIDYSLLVRDFLKASFAPASDINKDGKVDLKDYSILVSNIFQKCS